MTPKDYILHFGEMVGKNRFLLLNLGSKLEETLEKNTLNGFLRCPI